MYLYGGEFSRDTTEESWTLHEFSNESMERSVSLRTVNLKHNDWIKNTSIQCDVDHLWVFESGIYFFFTCRALYSHFTGILGAASCDKPGKPFMAEIVGAAYEHEITLMNSLTVNLHLMMQVSKLIWFEVLISKFGIKILEEIISGRELNECFLF